MSAWSFLGLLAGWLFYALLLIGIPGGILVLVLYFFLRAARSLWENHRA